MEGRAIAAPSKSKLEEISDAIAGLTLEEGHSLAEQLTVRLGTLVPSLLVNSSNHSGHSGYGFGCCGAACPAVFPGGHGSPAAYPGGQGSPTAFPGGHGSIWAQGKGDLLARSGPRAAVGQGKPPVSGHYMELTKYLELREGFEDNLRKPELSELEEVKNLLCCDMFVMENTSADIRVIVKRLQNILGEATASVESEVEDLLNLTYTLDSQVIHTKSALHILRKQYAGDSGLNSLASSSEGSSSG